MDEAHPICGQVATCQLSAAPHESSHPKFYLMTI